MRYPRISIITPSFNQGKYLEECILSVLNQNYPELEYIIIDGGSSDNSVEIIKKYADRITYWESEKDRGQSHALNKGFARCSGEIISWLCSDDLYLPGALYKVAELFAASPESCLVHGKTILFGQGRKEIIKGANREDLPLKYFSIIPFPQPSSFFRKKVIDEQGILDENFHYGMDYDLLIRIALHYPILQTDHIFSRYRLHAESKTVKILPSFAEDWSQVFLKFLRSVDGGEKFIRGLREEGILADKTDKYFHHKKFSEEELKTIYCHFLLNQLIIYYEVLNRAQCKKFLSMIRSTDPGFYNKYKLGKINLRIRYFPGILIRVIRKLLR